MKRQPCYFATSSTLRPRRGANNYANLLNLVQEYDAIVALSSPYNSRVICHRRRAISRCYIVWPSRGFREYIAQPIASSWHQLVAVRWPLRSIVSPLSCIMFTPCPVVSGLHSRTSAACPDRVSPSRHTVTTHTELTGDRLSQDHAAVHGKQKERQIPSPVISG